MAVTTVVAGQLVAQAAAPFATWTTDTLKCALVTSLASWNKDTTVFWSTLSGSEVGNANGYTTGGATVGSPTKAYDAATHRYRFKGSVPGWVATGAGFSAVGAVVFSKGAAGALADNAAPVVAVIDFGGTQSANNGGTFTVTLDSTDGLFYVQG